MTAITAPTSATVARSYLRAEWIKLRTVRSTHLALLAAAVAAIGIAALACGSDAHHIGTLNPAERLRLLEHGNFDPASQSMVGNIIGQLAVGVLGILVVSSEYASGMIRSSLAAMPNRRGWLAAKLAVFAAVALVAGQVMTFGAFTIGQAMYSSQHLGMSLSDPGAMKVVVTTGLYISLVGMLGAGLGFIIRHTTGAITALIALTLVVPQLAGALPTSWQDKVLPFLPESMGERAASVRHLEHHLSTWTGIGMMCVYAVVAIGVAAFLLDRRDA